MFWEKGRWLIVIFVLGVIIMFILFGIFFYLLIILELKYDIYGIWKGCVFVILLFVLLFSFYMVGKKIGDN